MRANVDVGKCAHGTPEGLKVRKKKTILEKNNSKNRLQKK